MQIQLNAILLSLERHTPVVPIKEDFHNLWPKAFRRLDYRGMKSRIMVKG
jgi:hypothetical protein